MKIREEIRLSIGFSFKTTNKFVIAIISGPQDQEEHVGYYDKEKHILPNMTDNVACFETKKEAEDFLKN